MKRSFSRSSALGFFVFLAVATVFISHSSTFAQKQKPASLPLSVQTPTSVEWFEDDKRRPRFSPPVRDLQRPDTSEVIELALSPDGSVLALLEKGGKGFRVSLWDVAKGTLIRHLPAADEYAREAHVEFSHGGKMLLFREDTRIALYDTQGVKQLLAVSPSSCIEAVALSHDDTRLLVGLSDATVELWDVPTAKQLHSFKEIEGREIQLLFFSPSSPAWGVVAGNNAARYLHLYDIPTGKRLMTSELATGRAQAAIFSPDGKSIVMRDGEDICVLKLSEDLSSLLHTKIIRGEFSGLPIICFSEQRPDVALFATATDFDAVSLVSLEKLQQPCRDGEVDPVHYKTGALAIRTGQLVSIVDDVLRVYTPDWQQQLLRVACAPESEPNRGRAQSLCISGDGDIAATLWENSSAVTLVDVASAWRESQKALSIKRQNEEKRLEAEAAERLAAEAERLATEQRTQAQKAAELKTAHQRRQAFLPKWADYEDLNQLLETFDPKNPRQSLDSFVRFGNSELANKAAVGDRFDREEAVEAAAVHREGLRRRKFLWQAKYKWDDKEPSAGREGTVRLRVPLHLRCFVPAHDADIGVANYSEWPLWYLTKDRALKPCANPLEAARVANANGVLYAPEILGHSELVLWVDGPREDQKAVAREPDQHVVNIGLSQLMVERPSTLGFYKWSAVQLSDYTSGSLLIAFENGDNGPEDQPNYFVTRAVDAADARATPEVVSAWVDKVEVVNVASKERRVIFSWARE